MRTDAINFTNSRSLLDKKPRFSYGKMVLLNLSGSCLGIPKGACPLWVRVVKKSQTFQNSVTPENKIFS